MPRSRELPPESLPSIEIFPGGPGWIPPAVDSAPPPAKQVLVPGIESGNASVPLMGGAVRPGRFGRDVATVDLAPTLARLLGIPAGNFDGAALEEALG